MSFCECIIIHSLISNVMVTGCVASAQFSRVLSGHRPHINSPVDWMVRSLYPLDYLERVSMSVSLLNLKKPETKAQQIVYLAFISLNKIKHLSLVSCNSCPSISPRL